MGFMRGPCDRGILASAPCRGRRGAATSGWRAGAAPAGSHRGDALHEARRRARRKPSSKATTAQAGGGGEVEQLAGAQQELGVGGRPTVSLPAAKVSQTSTPPLGDAAADDGRAAATGSWRRRRRRSGGRETARARPRCRRGTARPSPRSARSAATRRVAVDAGDARAPRGEPAQVAAAAAGHIEHARARRHQVRPARDPGRRRGLVRRRAGASEARRPQLAREHERQVGPQVEHEHAAERRRRRRQGEGGAQRGGRRAATASTGFRRQRPRRGARPPSRAPAG